MLHWTSVRDPHRVNARLVRNTLRLSQEFFEGLPVVFVPAVEEGLAIAVGETAVIEGEFGAGAAIGEFEFYDRVDAGVPVHGAPGLDDALVRQQFDVPARDDAAKHGEGAADFGADLRWRCSGGHARLHGVAELDDALELFRVGESFVDTLGAGCERDLLVNGFGGVGDGVIGVCVSFCLAEDKCADG
jgi:hypothetical protein